MCHSKLLNVILDHHDCCLVIGYLLVPSFIHNFKEFLGISVDATRAMYRARISVLILKIKFLNQYYCIAKRHFVLICFSYTLL